MANNINCCSLLPFSNGPGVMAQRLLSKHVKRLQVLSRVDLTGRLVFQSAMGTFFMVVV